MQAVDIRAVKVKGQSRSMPSRLIRALTKMGSMQISVPVSDSETAAYDAGGTALAGPSRQKFEQKFECLRDLAIFFLVGQESQQLQVPCRARHQVHNPTPHYRANSAMLQ